MQMTLRLFFNVIAVALGLTGSSLFVGWLTRQRKKLSLNSWDTMENTDEWQLAFNALGFPATREVTERPKTPNTLLILQ